MDRFGNALAPGLPYARGTLIRSTEDDFAKLRHAWEIMAQRSAKYGPDSLFNFTGLERGLHMDPSDAWAADDDLAPSVYFDRLTELGLRHLGGSASQHDVLVTNRLTAAIFATHLVMVKPNDTVIGVSAGYSHPAIVRAVAHVGGKLVDTVGLDAFLAALQHESRVSLVALTRVSVTYDTLPAEELTEIVRRAHEKGIPVFADDAGGARIGPAVFGQPRTLELGVEVGATGLDKYGVIGPRLGLLGGERDLVGRIRTRAFELGLEARPMLYPAVVKTLEQYSDERVRVLVETTKRVTDELRRILGDRVHETPVTGQLLGDDLLELVTEKAGLARPPVVPVEATAALAMILLRDHGIGTVHFAGMPPGTSALLFKFIPPETLSRFGGAAKFAQAVARSVDELARTIGSQDKLQSLLFGEPRVSPARGRATAAVAG